MHHLVGVTEIAAMLDLSRQRVHKLSRSDPTFPAPEAVLAGGVIWKRTDVEAWAKATGRVITKPQ